MKKITIPLPYDEERLMALRLFLEERHLKVEEELAKALDVLYDKTVPQPVRHYIELLNGERQNQPQRKPRPEPPALAGEAKRSGE